MIRCTCRCDVSIAWFLPCRWAALDGRNCFPLSAFHSCSLYSAVLWQEIHVLNATAVISCDNPAILVEQRGFTVPKKWMNQSMLWWLVDFSHTKIVLCLKYIPRAIKHEWGWACFPALKWISNLLLLPADLCLSVKSAVRKELAMSTRERSVRWCSAEGH